MKFLIFFIILGVASCSQVNNLRQFLRSFDYTATGSELRNSTEHLINETRREFADFGKSTEIEINQSLETINGQINIILNYSTNRTGDLINHLLQEIQDAQAYQEDYSECLTTVKLITSFSDSFTIRTQLSLKTSIRFANTTIRENVATMKRLELGLDKIVDSLAKCTDDDAVCMIDIATQVTDTASTFLECYEDITEKIMVLPKTIVSEATIAANQTVYDDETYACENADLVKTCIKTFNDDAPNDDTTTKLPSTSPTDVTTEITYTTSSITSPSTKSPSTVAPKVYCQHDPFVPPVSFEFRTN